MLNPVTSKNDRFRETGITRGMVNRLIPAWNLGLAEGMLARAIDHVRDDVYAVHLLQHHLSYLRGYATTWRCSGNCNGYEWKELMKPCALEKRELRRKLRQELAKQNLGFLPRELKWLSLNALRDLELLIIGQENR